MSIDPNTIIQVLNSPIGEKVYKDLLSLPLTEVSELITDMVKFIHLPVQHGLNLLRNRLQVSIEKVRKEDRVRPLLSISVPIIEKLSYIEEGNILVTLFQNLLARAMDKTRNSEAHPAFIFTINQLSPDEALLLYELKFNKFKFTRLADLDKRNKFYNHRMENNEFPVGKLVFANNFDMYIGHLEKLDLICVIDKQSQALWKDATNNREQVGSRETYTMGFTKFGALFVKACLPNKE